MMNWMEFSLQSQLMRSLRFSDRLTEKYFIVRVFIYYIRYSMLDSSLATLHRHEQLYYRYSAALRQQSCSSCSRLSCLGIADCERMRTTEPSRPLSLGSTFRKCTTERQFLKTGMAWQKQLKCRSLVCSTSSPLIAIILRSSLPSSGELDLWRPTAKSLSISWYDTVRLFLPRLGTMRYAASSLSPLALQNLASFLAVLSRWQSQTMAAQFCSTFQFLAASQSTASSCQKQCSSMTKLADSAITVSLPSTGRDRNRFLSLQWLLLCAPSSSSSCSSDCGRFSPFSTVLHPSSFRMRMPFSRLASSLRSSLRSSAGCLRAICAMLSVSSMLNWSLLRCDREVRSLAL